MKENVNKHFTQRSAQIRCFHLPRLFCLCGHLSHMLDDLFAEYVFIAHLVFQL